MSIDSCNKQQTKYAQNWVAGHTPKHNLRCVAVGLCSRPHISICPGWLLTESKLLGAGLVWLPRCNTIDHWEKSGLKLKEGKRRNHEEHGLLARAPWLLSLLSYTSQARLHKSGDPDSGLCLPTSIINQANAQQTDSQGNLIETISLVRFPPSCYN